MPIVVSAPPLRVPIVVSAPPWRVPMAVSMPPLRAYEPDFTYAIYNKYLSMQDNSLTLRVEVDRFV